MRTRTGMLGRFGLRSLLLVATCMTTAGILVAASSAEAASTYYLQGVSCLVIQQSPNVPNNTGYPLLQGLLNDSVPPQTVADIATIPRPLEVVNYRGTANLYWAPILRLIDNNTGQYVQRTARGIYASPPMFHASHGWLSYLWWGQQPPPDNFQLSVPAGYTLEVWGRTEWLNRNGQYFYSENRYLGGCRAA
jgi:hypothetical protein